MISFDVKDSSRFETNDEADLNESSERVVKGSGDFDFGFTSGGDRDEADVAIGGD